MQIGQEVIVECDKEVIDCFSGEVIKVDKGTKGVVNCWGNIKYLNGRAEGCIVPEQRTVEYYDIKNISKLIFERLNKSFDLVNTIIVSNVDERTIVSEIEDVLYDIF